MKKVRALGLAVLAIGPMSMIAASGAEASEFHVTNWQNFVIVTGEQHATQHNFKLTESGLETVCTTATFEGTPPVQVNQQTNQVTFDEVTLTGRYTGCQSQGPFKAASTVDMNGCKYTLTSSINTLTVKMDITGCTAGKQIQITTGEGCTIDVPEQSPVGHILGTNITEEVGGAQTHAVTAHVTVAGVIYQTTGAFCVLGQGVHGDGDYTGTVIFRAYEDEGNGFKDTHNGHQFTTLNCGTRLQLYAT